ncbi:MAG: 30S ribosome-binding factor RbfA [Proteobacteria bacterium]|nr:30S ribosome-binding factor RbfA [Pseudomonadota bacterium]
MPREFSRNKRLAAQVLRTLSELLRFEIKDPSLDGVSLTIVEMTRDLSLARVYFSLLNPDDDPDTALQGLRRASGFLRGKLGSALKVRHVPELRFLHDDSVARGMKISKLIENARNADANR